eukprot:scaffold20428_cov64-Cylindrotheca_fusiformis.AAC.1
MAMTRVTCVSSGPRILQDTSLRRRWMEHYKPIDPDKNAQDLNANTNANLLLADVSSLSSLV